MFKIERLKGPSIRITASADDWELYNSDTLEQQQERDMATDILNQGLEKIIAEAPTRKEISWTDIECLLRSQRHWGAADSEGFRHTEDILDQVYGE
jgi:hypothetical protein